MKKSSVFTMLLLAIAITFATVVPANAIIFEYLDSFDTNENVEGLAYDSVSGNIFTVNFSDSIFEYQIDGTFVGAVSTDIDNIRGLDILTNGNFVVASNFPGSGRIVELNATGAVVSGGIDITLDGSVGDNNGVVFDSFTGTIFAADEDDNLIRQYSTDGTFLSLIDTEVLGLVDTEGIEIDPLTGHFLVSDDLQFSGPIAELYEIDRRGSVVSFTDLSLVSELETNQLQGLAIGDGKLFAGQGTAARVDIFASFSTV